MNSPDKRKKQRQLFDGVLEIYWQDGTGNSRITNVRAIDLSKTGVRVESPEPIEQRTEVYVRAEQYGLTASTLVRHCSHRGAKYVLGLEFNNDTKAPGREDGETPVDYYEALQISPNAEPETIHRVYRMMAARYHPDNTETGNQEKFLLLTKAYNTLSDADRRAAYDESRRNQRTQPLPMFGLKEFGEGVEGEANRRLGILYLLYQRRRTHPDDPGLSMLEFEALMSFPREHLEFGIWFLSEKQYIRPGHNSDYAITASGTEHLEAALEADGAFRKLLKAAAPVERRSQCGTDDPAATQTLAIVRARPGA